MDTICKYLSNEDRNNFNGAIILIKFIKLHISVVGCSIFAFMCNYNYSKCFRSTLCIHIIVWMIKFFFRNTRLYSMISSNPYAGSVNEVWNVVIWLYSPFPLLYMIILLPSPILMYLWWSMIIWISQSHPVWIQFLLLFLFLNLINRDPWCNNQNIHHLNLCICLVMVVWSIKATLIFQRSIQWLQLYQIPCIPKCIQIPDST